MSLPSLAEQFRQHFPDIDQHYREQERMQEESRLAKAALLAEQEHAAIQAQIDQWQAGYKPDNDPCVYDAEIALELAREQGVSWSQVVLNGLNLAEAGRRMSREARRLDVKHFPPKLQTGVAGYFRIGKRHLTSSIC